MLSLRKENVRANPRFRVSSFAFNKLYNINQFRRLCSAAVSPAVGFLLPIDNLGGHFQLDGLFSRAKPNWCFCVFLFPVQPCALGVLVNQFTHRLVASAVTMLTAPLMSGPPFLYRRRPRKPLEEYFAPPECVGKSGLDKQTLSRAGHSFRPRLRMARMASIIFHFPFLGGKLRDS